MMGINWYLCEATREGSPLPRGTTTGTKVYCKRSPISSNRVMVLGIGRNGPIWDRSDQCVTISCYAAKRCLRIIRRLNDGQSKKLDLLALDAEYLTKSVRSNKKPAVP